MLHACTCIMFQAGPKQKHCNICQHTISLAKISSPCKGVSEILMYSLVIKWTLFTNLHYSYITTT